MRQHFIRFEVEEGEVDKVLQELSEAQEKIRKCYSRLMDLGVMTIREKLPAATDSPANQSSFSSSSTNE